MTKRLLTLTVLLVSLIAQPASATTFIVPDDTELVAKSPAIVTGHITGSSVRERDTLIETIYQLRVERVLKGPIANGTLLEVTSLGGVIDGRFTIVHGAAHFSEGDRVLLFLTPYHGGWTPTDLVLGKFRFATTLTGANVLLRDDDDIVGWDRDGSVHVERVRRESEFLRFIGRRVQDQPTTEDYFVDVKNVAASRSSFDQSTSGLTQQTNAAFPPATYTNHFRDSSGNGFPARWANMSAGVTYRKNASQNASGLADGGVGVIQNALASWTNECGSAINLIYGGTTTAVRNGGDGINVVLFNDPNGDIPGSWTGAGTIAITFGQGGSFHTFAGRSDWVSITSEDVVFQDGYPGNHGTMPTAMTHEIGHSIGWRHSNAHWLVTSSGTDAPCDPSVEECTSSAIMNASVIASFGYTLQAWDVNASQAVYPGGTCGPPPPPPPVGGVRRGDVNGDSVADIVWRHDNGSNYLWLMANGNVSQAIGLPSVGGTYQVVANGDFNGDGRSDLFWRDAIGTNVIWLMNGANVTAAVTLPMVDPTWRVVGTGDVNADGRYDVIWRRTTGDNYLWLMNGTTVTLAVGLPLVDTSWIVAGMRDLNGDSRADIVWRRSDGVNYLWLMNGSSVNAVLMPSADTSWSIAAVADVSGDGKGDIFWRRTNGDSYVWIMNGAAIVASGGLASVTDTNLRIVGWGDFNGDLREDILWRHGTNGYNVVWLMNGTSIINAPTIAGVADTGWHVVAPK